MTFFSGVHFLTDSQCKFRPNTKGAAAIAQQEADVEEEKAELQRRTNPHAAFGSAGFKKLEGSTGGNSSSAWTVERKGM